MHKLVLASQSPRRKELLETAGFKFTTLTVKVSEILEKNLTLEKALLRLARQKSEAAQEDSNLLELKPFILLTADTVVVLDNEVLGKPETPQIAVDYLVRLSGKTHRVITTVCLFESESQIYAEGLSTTFVTFRELELSEIQDYVASGEPMDKAGAYGIQGEAHKFVSHVEGEWDTVVGLPVRLVQQLLEDNNWHVDKR